MMENTHKSSSMALLSFQDALRALSILNETELYPIEDNSAYKKLENIFCEANPKMNCTAEHMAAYALTDHAFARLLKKKQREFFHGASKLNESDMKLFQQKLRLHDERLTKEMFKLLYIISTLYTLKKDCPVFYNEMAQTFLPDCIMDPIETIYLLASAEYSSVLHKHFPTLALIIQLINIKQSAPKRFKKIVAKYLGEIHSNTVPEEIENQIANHITNSPNKNDWLDFIKLEENQKFQLENLNPGRDWINKVKHFIERSLPKTTSQSTDISKLILEKLQMDAKVLHTFLTPQTTIFKEQNTLSETPLHFSELKNVDAILIFGNNDVKQVEHIATLYKGLNGLPKKIFISGPKGYGTASGTVFGLGEAGTLAQKLLDSGLSNIEDIKKIVVDETETNPSEIIKNIDSLLANDPLGPFEHILISGTPVEIISQARAFEVQSRYPSWKRISTFPPFIEEIITQYYSDLDPGIIHFLAALRALGNFLDFTVNSNFLSSREVPDKEALANSIRVLLKYYSLFTYQQVDETKFIENFLEFSRLKSLSDNGLAQAKLKDNLNEQVRFIADYFRFTFSIVELSWLQLLSPKQTLWEERQGLTLEVMLAKAGIQS